MSDARIFQVCRHQAVFRGIVVREEINDVALNGNGPIVVIEVGCHLGELGVFLPEVAHEYGVAVACTAFIQEHDAFFFVYANGIKPLGVCRVLIEQYILRLRRSYLVVIDLVPLIDIGKLLPLHGQVIGTVIKAVAVPCRARELCPLDVIVEQFPRLGIHDIELLPV